jgi:predicted nucleic acid-binding protein
MVRIYLDVSCLIRPDDDQQQTRIRLETEAISIIMEDFESGRWLQLASDMMVIEINAGDDLERRHSALSLLPSDIAPLSDAVLSRAMDCEKMGFKPADAVHVAAAEAMDADVLLTCDDRMLKVGARNRSRLHVVIANPLSWLKEQDDDTNAR